MKLDAILSGVEILRADSANPDIQKIQYDSRKVEQGDVFVAIKGYLTDGHLYIPGAIERGAAAVVVTEWQEGLSVPQIQTPDNRRALAQMSVNLTGDPSKELAVIGITASNGKTTTAKLLTDILRANHEETGVIGTVNYEYGDVSIPSKLTTPESLELQGIIRDMKTAGMESLVMEVSSQGIEMSRVHGIHFKQIAMNNITREHIDQHGSFENYWNIKQTLITKSDPETEIVLNADDAHAISLLAHRPDAYTFAHHETADLQCRNLDLSTGFPEFDIVLSARFKERTGADNLHVKVGVAGYHMVLNTLSAVALALLHGVPKETVEAAVKNYGGVERRFQMLYDREYKIVDDHFANVGNINVTLETLKHMEYKRLLPVYAIRGNRGVTVNRENLETFIPRLQELRAEPVIATTSRDATTAHDRVSAEEEALFRTYMDEAGAPYTLYDSLEEAIQVAAERARPGDVVLLAGCQGIDAGGEIFLRYLQEKNPALTDVLDPVKDRICGKEFFAGRD